MQVIQEVRNRTCSSDADCFHYAPCDVYGTHDCVCFPNYEPYTLCSAPSWQAQSDVQTSFYVYKGVSFGLQGLVLLCSLAFLCLNVWRALPTLRKTATGAVRWKRLFSTEQIGLLMVLLSALCDIVYMAVDPYWRQWMVSCPSLGQGGPACSASRNQVSQPHEAFLFMFGDIFLAFDTVAYGILTMLWIRIRTEAKMGRAWRLPGRWHRPVARVAVRPSRASRVFVGVCMALPFVGVLICFVLRAVRQPLTSGSCTHPPVSGAAAGGQRPFGAGSTRHALACFDGAPPRCSQERSCFSPSSPLSACFTVRCAPPHLAAWLRSSSGRGGGRQVR